MLDSRTAVAAAARDVRNGLAHWRLWTCLGWRDIRNRYRRSKLGPFWVSISTGVYVAAIGFVWGSLFGMELRKFLPYLCAGTLVWNLLVNSVTEGCSTFTAAASYITQTNSPLSTYAYWVVWRNVLVFLHTMVVYVALAGLLAIRPNANTLLLLVSLPILLLAVSWPPVLFGMLAARFRDVPQIIQSAMTVAFFVTPIMWRQEQLGERAWFEAWNPFAHLVEIVRAPMLGEPVAGFTLVAALTTTLVGWAITLWAFSLYRGRVAYWL
jgi:ABC-type polysaccharide/polyol phosphate export permease